VSPIAGELDNHYVRIKALQASQQFKRGICGTIVDIYNLPLCASAFHRTGHSLVEPDDKFLFVIDWDYD
jgi:hypothetical protein